MNSQGKFIIFNLNRKLRRYILVMPVLALPIFIGLPASFNIYWLSSSLIIIVLLAVIIYPSVVKIAFTVTPMSAPGSAALLILFRLSSTHRCCHTWGFGFHPSLSTGVCANAAVYFKAINPTTLLHRFFVYLHMHDTTYSFRISPCPLCSLLWISWLSHSTEIDSYL